MKLYLADDMTACPQWAGTQDEANRLWGRGRWEAVDVPTDKPGLIVWLNRSDEGVVARNFLANPSAELAAATSYSARAIAIEDMWEAMPLAQQLHFAALAMERARSEIGR